MWTVPIAGGSVESKDTESNRNTSSSEVHEEDQYTIGTTLPVGRSIADKLSKWASNDEKIMAHPMPIGGLELVPLVDAIT